jgi:hypothetical protein
MPTTSAKNLPLTPTSSDLGFGAGQLEQQLRDEISEQEKRRRFGLSARGQPGSPLPILSPASMSLFQVGR